MHYSLFSVSCRWVWRCVFLCLSVCAPREPLTTDLLCVWAWIYMYTLGKTRVFVCEGGKEVYRTEECGCVRAEWGISK